MYERGPSILTCLIVTTTDKRYSVCVVKLVITDGYYLLELKMIDLCSFVCAVGLGTT